MSNTTGIVTAWVLVHDGDKVIVAQWNEEQCTETAYTPEVFDTEEAMNTRIASLGLTPLPVEEEEQFYLK